LLRGVRQNKPDGQGIREFIAILKLHQTYPVHLVEQAVQLAVHSGIFSLDGVKYYLLQQFCPLPATGPLDLSHLPHLASIGCQPVDLQIYNQLLGVK
jgi:hypothetical protein